MKLPLALRQMMTNRGLFCVECMLFVRKKEAKDSEVPGTKQIATSVTGASGSAASDLNCLVKINTFLNFMLLFYPSIRK